MANNVRQPKIPAERDYTPDALSERSHFISQATGADVTALHNSQEIDCYKGNVENIFGFIQIPVGLAGPLLLKGHYATGSFFVPLATTEGTLVASYNRGMKAITQCGGARVEVVKNEIYSSITFLTERPESARSVRTWILNHEADIKKVAEATTKHGRYLRCECTFCGSRLIVNLVYNPADAMGINMITSASYAASKLISQQNGNIQFLLPSALQGDKKATFYNFHHGRGRSVTAEVVLTDQAIAQTLKSTAELMYRGYQAMAETAPLAGSLGFNLHIANGITALALATGQDAAYVGESANGHLVMEKQGDELFVSLYIPSLYVGTVGGGTALPTHKPCLEMMTCKGENSALKLAEIFAGTCLAGEISTIAAISSYQFVSAHDALGRNRPRLR